MKRILIVDDDALVRDMLDRLLRRAGYDTETAENGARALSLHRKQPADLVITDILMPEKEGIETLMELHRLTPDVPVIAISGGGRIGPESYLSMATLLGAERAFAKPVDTAQLLRAVGELTA